jgi:threonine dehydrogenase-like Zn-dependent dehydrogenase
VKAFVITGPGQAGVQDVESPVAAPGEVVVNVARAGVCGTDIEFFTGGMQYLHDGSAEYPMRIGHEWMGTVNAIGEGVDARWLGRRVTGDTMLGCGACRRCTAGYQWVCNSRTELGILGGLRARGWQPRPSAGRCRPARLERRASRRRCPAVHATS